MKHIDIENVVDDQVAGYQDHQQKGSHRKHIFYIDIHSHVGPVDSIAYCILGESAPLRQRLHLPGQIKTITKIKIRHNPSRITGCVYIASHGGNRGCGRQLIRQFSGHQHDLGHGYGISLEIAGKCKSPLVFPVTDCKLERDFLPDFAGYAHGF